MTSTLPGDAGSHSAFKSGLDLRSAVREVDDRISDLKAFTPATSVEQRGKVLDGVVGATGTVIDAGVRAASPLRRGDAVDCAVRSFTALDEQLQTALDRHDNTWFDQVAIGIATAARKGFAGDPTLIAATVLEDLTSLHATTKHTIAKIGVEEYIGLVWQGRASLSLTQGSTELRSCFSHMSGIQPTWILDRLCPDLDDYPTEGLTRLFAALPLDNISYKAVDNARESATTYHREIEAMANFVVEPFIRYSRSPRLSRGDHASANHRLEGLFYSLRQLNECGKLQAVGRVVGDRIAPMTFRHLLEMPSDAHKLIGFR
jgi:hypothetical protein